MVKDIVFNQEYYTQIMTEFGYDPLRFRKINFSLGDLSEEDLQLRWLCHHDGDIFAHEFNETKNTIVSTGFGMSGIPHIGTLSQILRSITLQKAGLPVQLILGDFDAYNGKNKPLEQTLELAEHYRAFALNLGFNPNSPSILRSQANSLDVLRTSYIIGHYMDDKMFDEAEEDTHEMYVRHNKVDPTMSYRRKLSLNLMTADFIHLHTELGYKSVLVMLGIDEHKYVQFAKKTLENMKEHNALPDQDVTLAGIYSSVTRGFNGYPKMSKSIPNSGISVDMTSDQISNLILFGEGSFDKPENSTVYQMMAEASNYTFEQLKQKYRACLEGGNSWKKAKMDYVDVIVDICKKW